MDRSVLVITRRLDGHADRLCSELVLLGVQPIRVNIEDIPRVRFEINGDQLLMRFDDRVVDARLFTSVFIRALPASEDFGVESGIGDVTVEGYVAIQDEALFHDWLNTLGLSVPLYNDFQAATQCSGKGYQRVLARRVGFETPSLYIGADPEVASAFSGEIWDAGGEVCTKPVAHKTVLINGTRSSRYTEKLPRERADELQELNACPLIFQNYVEKDYELRITVVDGSVLPCRISSQEAGGETAVDWRRYNIARTPHSPYKLPEAIEEQLFAFHRLAGLRFSAFDLIRTVHGRYLFLETNPTGQWLWLEDLAGIPISKAVASALAHPQKLRH